MVNIALIEKSRSFWLLQLLGWTVLCVLTYFSLTIWYTTEEFINNILHIVLQAIVGLLLSLVLRQIFLRLWDVQFYIRLFFSALSIIVVAMIWNIIRMQLFIFLVVADEHPLQEHPDWVFDKASIFFDFGKEISSERGQVYYWDNVQTGEVLTRETKVYQMAFSEVPLDLPLDFDHPNANYLFTDFGGANTSITEDPTGLDTRVAASRKWPNSLDWAGTSMSSASGFASPIPLTTNNSKMTVWVYADLPEVTVRLKLETHDNPEHAMELERTLETQHQWTPFVFDFNYARAGDYEHRVNQIWRDFGGWYYAAILIFMCWASLYHLIKYAWLLKLEMDKAHDQAKEARLKSAQALIEAKEAQLQMLRYQLNPHFLFNTLNSVYALIKLSDVEVAKSMVKKLSGFLRYSLESNPNELIKLSQEIEALELYLSIEKVRFEDRLEFTYSVSPEAADCLMPGMLLQPLVENSIKYAVANREDQGIIKVEADVKDGVLHIALSDNGPDANTETQVSQTSTGIGMKNIKQRLSTLYKEQYSFEMVPLSPSGLMVQITIPAQYS